MLNFHEIPRIFHQNRFEKTLILNAPTASPFQQLLSILIFFRMRLMLSLNRRNPSIVQVRLPASRRDFSFPFRRFPDFPSKARAREKKKKKGKRSFPDIPSKARARIKKGRKKKGEKRKEGFCGWVRAAWDLILSTQRILRGSDRSLSKHRIQGDDLVENGSFPK